MIERLETFAEKKAQEAETLPAFDGLNLLGVKRKIETILGLIGRDGIFDEYTFHDISHIDAMLESLDWLIPNATKAIMSPADWLTTVLAVYFHDMGMLVTRDEFSNRNRSGFPEFCETTLFAEDIGVDYKAKVDALGPEKSERFLYQEFVRHTHAVRIREWIMGKASQKFGCSHQAMAEVADLLGSFDPQFRRDLGLVCESHHLDDLNDFERYKVSQPFGNSDAETVNLQYAAILLRTADLLHITRDRTPSPAFRLINPSDPISQMEWAKQKAVKRVRSQIARNKEGLPDEDTPRDTVEVHAYFTNPDGFFGLTSYLDYAQSQLQKSFEWVQEAAKTQGSRFSFPWKYIDDESIETHGFLKNSFRFTIDQAKILDLLTGHTLYNETSVVLRELVQNSLDAIRLRLHIAPSHGFSESPGSVSITWDSESRLLCILDNGTGMTQAAIEKHLLKVGASLYQDKEFKKRYPGFSSISRFGIGVLSTFMVSDSVEIVTSHPDEEHARMLNLRSVHGKYLVQLLDKSEDGVPGEIKEHGTCVRLHVRPSATIDDILKATRRWIVVPKCDVTVSLDGVEPVSVGYSSPTDALNAAVDASDNFVRWEDRQTDGGERDYRTKVRVEEVETGNATVAFALRWWEYFDEWSFVMAKEIKQSVEMPLAGICVEGIRVADNPPGYDSEDGVLAIVNASGPTAPKTNVARSGLEKTPEFDELLRGIYASYCGHVRDELVHMQKRRSFSLTWAAQEARWLLQSLFRNRPSSQEELTNAALQLPLILAERDGDRSAVSVRHLQDESEFWTIDGQFFRSAEQLIREASSSASLGDLVGALGIDTLEFPRGLIIFDTAVMRSPYDAVFERKEIGAVRIDRNQRRLDLRWSDRSDPPRWKTFRNDLLEVSTIRRYLEQRSVGKFPAVCVGDLEIEGRTDETAVKFHDSTFFLPGTKASEYISELIDLTNEAAEVEGRFAMWVLSLIDLVLRGSDLRNVSIDELRNDYRSGFVRTGSERLEDVKLERLMEVIKQPELFTVFDASRWTRQENA